MQIARWDNAYTDAPGYEVFNTADTEDHFIDRDPERFYVRVQDPSANSNNATVDTLSIRLGTEGDLGIDDLTQITLFETGPATGVFTSQSQLLTAWGFPIPDEGATPLRYTDDNFPAHDGLQGVVVDDAPNDRTHQGTVGGRVYMEYEGDGLQHKSSVAICHPDSIKTVKYRIVTFEEPYLDVGYIDPVTGDTLGAGNGEFDYEGKGPGTNHLPGVPSEPYLDLSYQAQLRSDLEYGEGSRSFPPGIYITGADAFSDDPTSYGRGSVFPNELILLQIERMRLSWAQACITMEENATIFIDRIPKNDAGEDVFADDGYLNIPKSFVEPVPETELDDMVATYNAGFRGCFDFQFAGERDDIGDGFGHDLGGS